MCVRAHTKIIPWKSVKPFLSDKGSNFSKIMLVRKNNIISDEEEIANIMNNYFINVAFLILGILELYTGKVCEIFVYKHTETIEYVKN